MVHYKASGTLDVDTALGHLTLPISNEDKTKIFEGNAKRIFSRLSGQIATQKAWTGAAA